MSGTPYSGPEGWRELIREGLRFHESGRSTDRGRLSRYERQGELGRGGVGLVYRAFDRELHRPVAIKILSEGSVARPEVLKRFQREGEVMAGLSHPNLVTIYDMGEEEGRPFIVMELVEGETLNQGLQRNRWSLRRQIELLEQTARGVGHAHAHGIVHRDLKPANILVTPSGTPKVADFGLAHLSETPLTLTQSGMMFGTPLYMAPEQVEARPEKLSARTDVYALGAILYEILTGAPPYAGGGSPAEVFTRILDQDPIPVRHRNPDVHPDVATICMMALERNPGDRYPTAREFAEDLHRFLEDQTILARSPSWPARTRRFLRRHKTASVAVGLSFSFVLGLAGVLAVRSMQRAQEQRNLLRRRENALQEIRAAIAEERWAGAAARCDEALKLDPGNPEIRIQERIARAMGRAVHALSVADLTSREIRSIFVPEVPAPAPASRRQAVWDAEDRLRRLKLELQGRWQEAEEAARTALALDPRHGPAQRILEQLALDRHRRAEEEGDLPMVAWWREQAIRHGGAEVLDRLDPWSTVTLTPSVEGTRAFLFRYEPQGRRLLPLPAHPIQGAREIELPPIDALPLSAPESEKKAMRNRTAYPLSETEFNEVRFPVRLRQGSYLILLKKEGFVDTRVPLLVEHGKEASASVRLLRAEEIPEGFVYVPAGKSILGGDPRAITEKETPPPRREIEMNGFLISRFAVTAEQYARFHLSLSREDQRKHEPHSGVEFHAESPVCLIAHESAEAFAAWFTGTRGMGKWTFRLPTEKEWERAARGADGRFFPWGNEFDYAFSAAFHSRSKAGFVPDRFDDTIGQFPADESPFGVRDMAGACGTWTSTYNADTKTWAGKGGSAWIKADACRAASRHWVPAEGMSEHLGIRLVADLPRPE